MKDKKSENSTHIFQRGKFKDELKLREQKWTERQKELFRIIESKESKIILVKGPAGTSKSFCAIYCGLKSLSEKKTTDLIYIRPIVESADKSMGALPGSTSDKVQPYGEVLEQKLDEILIKPQIEALKNDNRLHTLPVNFARGLHFANKFIIMDEFQNFNRKESLTLLSRIGEYCKVIICADPQQSDLKNGSANDFNNVYSLFNDEESRNMGIFCYEFTEEDIVRSKLCAFIVKKFKENKSAMF